MSKQSEAVKKWRKNTKQKMVESMGGKCQCCGYNRCNDALDLHHVNPLEKEFSFGSIIAKPKKWDKITEELKKCILLCSNCHREIHANLISLPNRYQKFDESLITMATKTEELDSCPICGKDKPKRQKTCSRSCAIRRKGCVDWSNIDLKELLLTNNVVQIAENLGCSESAVHKRRRKLNLSNPSKNN